MKNINLTLTPKQYNLLVEILEEVSDTRSDCGCNDVYEEELRMFSGKELQAVIESMGKGYARSQYREWKQESQAGNIEGTWEDALKGGWGLFDTSFITYLISVIKQQAKESNE